MAARRETELYLSDGEQLATGPEQMADRPAGVFGYLGDKWLAGGFPKQWFAVGGPGPQTVSQMNTSSFTCQAMDGGLARRPTCW